MRWFRREKRQGEKSKDQQAQAQAQLKRKLNGKVDQLCVNVVNILNLLSLLEKQHGKDAEHQPAATDAQEEIQQLEAKVDAQISEFIDAGPEIATVIAQSLMSKIDEYMEVTGASEKFKEVAIHIQTEAEEIIDYYVTHLFSVIKDAVQLEKLAKQKGENASKYKASSKELLKIVDEYVAELKTNLNRAEIVSKRLKDRAQQTEEGEYVSTKLIRVAKQIYQEARKYAQEQKLAGRTDEFQVAKINLASDRVDVDPAEKKRLKKRRPVIDDHRDAKPELNKQKASKNKARRVEQLLREVDQAKVVKRPNESQEKKAEPEVYKPESYESENIVSGDEALAQELSESKSKELSDDEFSSTFSEYLNENTKAMPQQKEVPNDAKPSAAKESAVSREPENDGKNASEKDKPKKGNSKHNLIAELLNSVKQLKSSKDTSTYKNKLRVSIKSIEEKNSGAVDPNDKAMNKDAMDAIKAIDECLLEVQPLKEDVRDFQEGLVGMREKAWETLDAPEKLAVDRERLFKQLAYIKQKWPQITGDLQLTETAVADVKSKSNQPELTKDIRYLEVLMTKFLASHPQKEIENGKLLDENGVGQAHLAGTASKVASPAEGAVAHQEPENDLKTASDKSKAKEGNSIVNVSKKHAEEEYAKQGGLADTHSKVASPESSDKPVSASQVHLLHRSQKDEVELSDASVIRGMEIGYKIAYPDAGEITSAEVIDVFTQPTELEYIIQTILRKELSYITSDKEIKLEDLKDLFLAYHVATEQYRANAHYANENIVQMVQRNAEFMNGQERRPPTKNFLHGGANHFVQYRDLLSRRLQDCQKQSVDQHGQGEEHGDNISEYSYGEDYPGFVESQQQHLQESRQRRREIWERESVQEGAGADDILGYSNREGSPGLEEPQRQEEVFEDQPTDDRSEFLACCADMINELNAYDKSAPLTKPWLWRSQDRQSQAKQLSEEMLQIVVKYKSNSLGAHNDVSQSDVLRLVEVIDKHAQEARDKDLKVDTHRAAKSKHPKFRNQNGSRFQKHLSAMRKKVVEFYLEKRLDRAALKVVDLKAVEALRCNLRKRVTIKHNGLDIFKNRVKYQNYLVNIRRLEPSEIKVSKLQELKVPYNIDALIGAESEAQPAQVLMQELEDLTAAVRDYEEVHLTQDNQLEEDDGTQPPTP